MKMCWFVTTLTVMTLCVSATLFSAEDQATVKYKPWTSGSAKVTSHRVVVRDGWYNQATDLCMWKGFYWLGYRRGVKHGPTSGMDQGANSFGVIWRSNDLYRWHEAKVFDSPRGVVDGSGVNCPRFVPLYDRLYVFMTVHRPTEQGTGIDTYNSWTEDGVNWSKPALIVMDNHRPMLWRVRHHDGKFYGATCFLDRPGPNDYGPLDLLSSEDGTHWSKVARIQDDFRFTEESDLHWLPNGELWCVVRPGAEFYWSQPPYTQWEGGMKIGWSDAPVMCQTGGQVYLAARGPAKVVPNPSKAEQAGPNGAPVLYRLSRGQAEIIVSFPAGSDASYSGLISPEPGKLIMTYYSDIAYQTRQIQPKAFPPYRYKYSDVDIYLAEIEVGTVEDKDSKNKE